MGDLPCAALSEGLFVVAITVCSPLVRRWGTFGDAEGSQLLLVRSMKVGFRFIYKVVAGSHNGVQEASVRRIGLGSDLDSKS